MSRKTSIIENIMMAAALIISIAAPFLFFRLMGRAATLTPTDGGICWSRPFSEMPIVETLPCTLQSIGRPFAALLHDVQGMGDGPVTVGQIGSLIGVAVIGFVVFVFAWGTFLGMLEAKRQRAGPAEDR